MVLENGPHTRYVATLRRFDESFEVTHVKTSLILRCADRHAANFVPYAADRMNVTTLDDAFPAAREMLHNGKMIMLRSYRLCLILSLVAVPRSAVSQSPASSQHVERPAPPTRDPNTPGYVTGKELPDGTTPPANADGNFILGPTHTPAPEMSSPDNVHQGTVIEFTMNSADSKIYPGIAREPRHFRHVRTPPIPPSSSSPPATPLLTRATSLSMSQNNMSPARSRRSSSERTDPTARCSPRSTI